MIKRNFSNLEEKTNEAIVRTFSTLWRPSKCPINYPKKVIEI